MNRQVTQNSSPLLHFAFPDAAGRVRPRVFSNPRRIIVAGRIDQVLPAIHAAQAEAQAGRYVAGFVAYESAAAFEAALTTRAPSDLPLVWLGVFDAPVDGVLPADDSCSIATWQPSMDQRTYHERIATVRAAIARGETYQTNYTFRLRARFAGDDGALYERLRAAQRARYCAYLNLGRYRILSASPELFFAWCDGVITTRPMKGTARRGRTLAEDEQVAQWLHESAKNRAENLMIVDLLRNDLGRIACIGSVHVPDLFAVERYPTVWQMTSTIAARTRPDTTLVDIFRALFPCGSITGAPKASTMRLIAALEDSPRGVYCGAIGLIEPGGAATFNVAIRTVTIDSWTGVAEYGVGGGITWDSTAEDEYDEALAKAALLSEPPSTFDLLETLRLEHGDYALRERHLQRLMDSARYFDVPLESSRVDAALDDHARRYRHESRRVRLLVSQAGDVRVESRPLDPLPSPPLPVALARSPVRRADRFLYHKTTHRVVYESHRAAQPHVFDVLLWNEAGEITEFTTGNVVVEIDDAKWTPPVDSGLLAGTLRAELIDRGEIAERIVSRDDLARATRIWLINGVRGWVEVRVLDKETGRQGDRET